jgi:uncharacterized protein
MRIGLIADTHDRLPVIRDFARQFSEGGASMILHAGDYCAPFALQALLEAQLPLVGVFGRSDGDRQELTSAALASMGELYESPHSLIMAERRILLLHELTDTQERSVEGHDLVVLGATHRSEMRNRGDALLINPGEACGWLHGAPSAALLDLNTLKVEFLTSDAG